MATWPTASRTLYIDHLDVILCIKYSKYSGINVDKRVCWCVGFKHPFRESSILETQSIIKCQKKGVVAYLLLIINFYFGGHCQQFIWYSVTDRLIHEMGGTESGTVSWILGTQSVWNNFVSSVISCWSQHRKSSKPKRRCLSFLV